MATPNYSYEKRQRELAKKRKKEEKLQKKSHRDDTPGHAPSDAGNNTDAGAPPPAEPSGG
ncbi:hypothetical protein [Ideonella sp. BN130291]|uniref:hypothetical protein n=1 Tax=Ideonella sp. BN130291 TaxID=3112940 RepID=UPI002E2675D7|nr:hypothetical protein [Ideonella sp. BN130291]